MIDKNEFEKNLEVCINELVKANRGLSEKSNDYIFFITPVIEVGKKYNSRDDYIRLWLLNDGNIKGREFNIREVIKLLTSMEPYFPLWIKVRLINNYFGKHLFELETSLRFRRPSVIMSQGMRYPPFIVEK